MPQSGKTAPKPFVFVLMPFSGKFHDIYKFGIKAVADDVGAYAERVDEQIYTEGILDRIFNQINKADVIVADMTGRNANVFYEVGYAHALNKIVLLLTQDADDIPFDLKHRQHIVYGGSIDELRTQLLPRLVWAVEQAARGGHVTAEERFTIYLGGRELAPVDSDIAPPILDVTAWRTASDVIAQLRLAIRNDSNVKSASVGHVYVFAAPESVIYPSSTLNAISVNRGDAAERLAFPAREADAEDGLTEQYHLKGDVPSLPSGGVESTVVAFNVIGTELPPETRFRLRLHTANRVHDFVFAIKISAVKAAEDIVRRTTLPVP